MKKVMLLLVGMAVLASCNKTAPAWPDSDQAGKTAYSFRILPVMTKVADTAFEEGDAVGVTITREAGAYATNEKLVYDGSEFAGTLMWYAEGADGATVKAYYPYAEAVPSSFTVQSDQRTGTSASDLVAGVKTGVLPSASPVVIPFRHQLTKIILKVTNNADGEPASISLSGARLTASLDADFVATVDESAAEGAVKAYKKDASTYLLILPPQKVALTASVETAGGQVLAQNLAETDLLAGKQYTIKMVVNPKDLAVAFAGDIEDWEEGGEIGGGDNTLIEQLDKGYITYHEQKYTVAQMKDGKWWMTQNLRYVPEGITVGDALTNVTAGVYYPLVLNADGSAAEFSKNIEVINANGYLYQAEVALGLEVGGLTSVEQTEALSGAQGICPKGWHVPTADDIIGLVGKAVSPLVTNADAPYYDGANGSIALLNADGFNLEAYGSVSIQDNTKAAGTFMGRMAGYDHLTSSMMCGSTYAGVTYNTSGDAASGIKNLQFYGLMPMTNKATEAQYTCNGTKVSYRIAGPLRCVRNN